MARHSKVSDEGAVFVIVPNTRKVTVPSAHFVIGTVGEHLSEQVTFECPTTIDGHDITSCEKKYVTWQSVDGVIGHDELVDMTVNENVVRFKWNIRNGLTTAKGVVSFSVHFEDTAAGDTVYKFSTTTCKNCEILESINGIMGAYEAVYVSDDALVFADYTLITDGELEIETNGLIPEGTFEITANGTYDVGKYSAAKVLIEAAMPTITVSENGIIRASTVGGGTKEYRLLERDDPDFKAENIKKGVNIFGVDGSYAPPVVEYAKGKIVNNSDITVTAVYCRKLYGELVFTKDSVEKGTFFADDSVVKHSLIYIEAKHQTVTCEGAEVFYMHSDASATYSYICKPTADNFTITVTSGKG